MTSTTSSTPGDFDIGRIAASFVQANAERFIGSAATGVKGVATQVRARFNSTYSTYIERILDRYGRGKSFFVRTEPTPLYQFFVPLNIRNQARRLARPSAKELFAISPFSILTGTGGSGKSMMMRHLLVSSVTSHLRTPIFVELRQLNHTSDSLRELLLRTLGDFGLEVDDKFVEAALKAGQFLLLLDGFDELERSARKRVAREVQRIADKYPQNWLVLSSRPDTALQGWDSFAEYRIEPLSLADATELVAKVPFDENVKQQFIADMRARLFDEHRSFLSNPLLLSIMLLTYKDVAHIPQKLSTFYTQAYESLFHRHDALKGGYQRERRCKLDIQEYARAFSAFALLSYDSREFSFTRTRALELLGAAQNTAMLEFDVNAFLDDAVQANCLMVEEGLGLVFSHRSFQEYFVARFIHASPPEVKAKLVSRYATVNASDSVMALLWEIDPYIVEKHYILPNLARIRTAVGESKILRNTHLLRYLRLSFGEFTIRDPEGDDEHKYHVGAIARDEVLTSAAHFAFVRYRNPVEVLGEEFDSRGDDELVEAFRSDHGDETDVPSEKLKPRGRVISLLAERGLYWGLKYLQTLYAIEREINKKHESNLESLESVLATARAPRRKIAT
jgi:hypothetical protein